MAKKSKKNTPPTPARAKEVPTDFGTIGDLLGRPAKPVARAATVVAPPPKPTPTEPRAPVIRELTEQDLMREAFDAAKRDDVYRGKYEGIGFDPGNVIILRAEPERGSTTAVAAPARLADRAEVTPEDLMFFDAMAEVSQVAAPNPYADRLAAHDWTGAKWADRIELTSLSAAELHEPSLTHEQRQLLRRSRSETMAVLNIRHLKRDEAMREVEAFVRACVRRELRFVRVVTGKGRQSVGGEPVLKPAVIRWCSEQGARWVRGWAPETDRSGNFGSVVVELRDGVV
jgi:DNA-nicking Smr family endonuclease